MDRLRTQGGSLALLEELHEMQPRRRVHAQPFVNALFHESALLAGRANLTSVFAEVDNEAARTLLAQVVIAFFVWDPLSLLAPDRDFDQRAEEHLAIMEQVERIGTTTGRNPLHILKDTKPREVVERVVFYSILHIMRRPLAFLFATGGVGDWLARTDLAPLSFNALIQERHATSPHPLTKQPYARQMIIQCPPPSAPAEAIDEKLAAAGIDVARFTPEDVFASFACGERVLHHARVKWNWRQLEELAKQMPQ